MDLSQMTCFDGVLGKHKKSEQYKEKANWIALTRVESIAIESDSYEQN